MVPTCSVQCSVFSVQCSVFSVQCSVCSVQCSVFSRLVFQGSHFGIFIGALVFQPLLNIYNHSTKKEIQEKFAVLCLWPYFFWGDTLLEARLLGEDEGCFRAWTLEEDESC